MKSKAYYVAKAIKSAESVLHIYEAYGKSKAPRKAIAAAKAWLKSPTEDNRKKVSVAAYAAAVAAYAAGGSAVDVAAYAAAAAAADAAYAAADAAYAAGAVDVADADVYAAYAAAGAKKARRLGKY